MSEDQSIEGVAIIGMSGRFPGAQNVDDFWRNLCEGRESIRHFTDEELLAEGAEAELLRDPTFVRARAVLEEVGQFDADFFEFTNRDAELTDPQHRLFLESCWLALEDAGYEPVSSPGNIGVYAGSSLNTYLLRHVLSKHGNANQFVNGFQIDGYNVLVGNDKDYLSSRVAFKLNLRGPAVTVQTACSTSLVAVCQAVAALNSYQCDMALAGGVSITFPQARGYLYQEGAIASADGHCRPFDAEAAGTVFGAGCGVVLLKRLDEAIADHDSIYAVIKGAALNNDGSDKVSYMAPSVEGQAEVISLAQALADVSADTVSYVEAHGTGTPLGDPIEVAALTQAFRATTDRNQFCGLGSLKGNVGHLEAAAGVASLIKTALSLKHRKLPPTLHYTQPNPKIGFSSTPFQVVSELKDWNNCPIPRRAGVSSFGVGGTNAHVVVEEAPEPLPTNPSRSPQLLILSARTQTALEAASNNLADWLESPPEHSTTLTPNSLADVAFTLQRGRKAFDHRRVLVTSDAADAVTKLRSDDGKSVFTGQVPAQEPSVVFLFPGQGAQYAGMGRSLYENETVFRDEIDRCAEILLKHLDTDIRELLYPDDPQHADAEKQINETVITQPAIFAVELALARLWMSWGVNPAALVGHSIGEYVCAVLAETFTLEDALALLATRARLMQPLPPGSMLAVRLAAAELEKLLPPEAAIAAVNSPKLCTVSGPEDLLSDFQQELSAKKIPSQFLPTSHAFHSAMMDPILPEFTAAAKRTARQAPKLPWISTCTGDWITPETMEDAGYWARQLRHTVQFTAALDTLLTDTSRVLIEVGPGQTLGQLTRQHPGRTPDQKVISSLLGNGSKHEDELASMLQGLGRLWIAGVTPDWKNYYANEQRRRMRLPTYPFERKRHWIEPSELPESARTAVPETQPDGFKTNAPQPSKPATQATGANGNAANVESTIMNQLRMMKEQLAVLEESSSHPE